MIITYDPSKELDVFNRMAQDGKFGVGTTDLWKKEFDLVKIEESCQFVQNQVSLCTSNWHSIEDNFQKKMSDFFEKDCTIPQDMTCYLVRYTTFPYSIEYKWFNAPLFGNPSERNRVIMHELCHYFTPKDISRSLKEAIPVILNDQESFQNHMVDRGHQNDPEEMRLRPLILEKFKSGKTYSQILSEVQ